jgi:hypothetical protein
VDFFRAYKYVKDLNDEIKKFEAEEVEEIN